jgi:predicted nucleotidyltransferase
MLNLKSKIAVKILGYYFLNPRRKHYVNELAKTLEVDPGNLFRKLKELETGGLLVSESVGNQRFFALNAKWPLLGEYKRIYQSQFALPVILKEKLSKLAGLKEAYIFGSFAKGGFSAESDIDIMVTGEHDHGELFKITAPLEKQLGREINLIDFSSREFAQRKKAGDDFVKQIFAGKVIRII